jgi:hypothetical protein
MLLLVSATGLMGFATSGLLLAAGVRSMWLRYPLAAWVAYLCFLFFVWLWILYRRGRLNPDPGDDLGLLPDDIATPVCPDPAPPSGDADFPVGFDVDEGLPVLLVLLVAGSVLLASGYLVATAPTLLAELIVDGVMSAALYRRLRKPSEDGWLSTAVRRTIVPLIGLIVALAIAGAALAWYAPEATTLGEALALGSF